MALAKCGMYSEVYVYSQQRGIFVGCGDNRSFTGGGAQKNGGETRVTAH